MTRLDNSRHIRAPRGSQLNAESWLTEAPLRMLMNNLDTEVAERPNGRAVNGDIGGAVRDIHREGGVGIGFSRHAGMVIVCDGTPWAGVSSVTPDMQPILG